MDAIKKSIDHLEMVIEREMPNIRAEVRRMIDEKETSVKKIETMLDTLLNLAYMGKAKDEFVMLNSYYSTINRYNAEFYRNYYSEITEGPL